MLKKEKADLKPVNNNWGICIFCLGIIKCLLVKFCNRRFCVNVGFTGPDLQVGEIQQEDLYYRKINIYC